MNDRLHELVITGFANGGAGIAHDGDGRVVFVTGALPGERVRARILARRASFATAATVDVLEPSAERIPPLCPAAAAGAGCCDLSYVAPSYAARLRSAALADVLQRIGKMDGSDTPEPPDVQELAESPLGWRVRTRLAVGDDGLVGLRARGSAQLVGQPCAGPVPGMLSDLEAMGAPRGSELVVAVGTDGARHVSVLAPMPRRTGAGRRSAQAARSRAARPRTSAVLAGGELVTERVGAHTWRVPVTGFWQAHRAAPLRYAQTVREFVAQADPGGPLRVWDLYGGAGILGAGLLAGKQPGAVEIDLVESDRGAVSAARRALAGEPVHVHRGEVGATIAGLPRPDVVIADPPRKGAGATVIAAIAAAAPGIVVHIGCDPAAFARDLRDYRRHGFRVADWRAFDAFPLTHHMEAIALLVSP